MLLLHDDGAHTEFFLIMVADMLRQAVAHAYGGRANCDTRGVDERSMFVEKHAFLLPALCFNEDLRGVRS